MSQSPAQHLSDSTLDAIVSALSLTEVLDENGGPYMTLTSHMPMAQGEVGKVRLFTGPGIDKLVTCSIVVPQIMLDSHMIFAFTAKDCAVPHFTLDSVKAGDHFSFHLDLIPRADLAVETAYMDAVFHPLTETYEQAEAVEGLERAHISPRQHAIMSPWMLVHRASEEAFKAITPFVNQYREYWQGLVDKGVDSPLAAHALEARDKANRAAIFSPDIDPVWQRIDGLIGEQAGIDLRALLKGE